MTAVVLGDGIAGMLALDPGCASLVLSDLPSGETRAEFDEKPELQAMWRAVWGALKPSGVAVFMASSLRFAAELFDSQSSFFRHELIWHKSLATGHLNASRAPLRAHEFVLVFCRRAPVYNPQLSHGHRPINAIGRSSRSGENWGPMTATSARGGATTRYPRTVLGFASVGTSSRKRTHPQQKPTELLQMLVRQYSNPGDLVLDPYAGSGSTLAAAIAEGRRAMGWDISPRFADARSA